MAFTGVYPASEVKFEIGTKGRASAAADMKQIEELESISVSIDGNMQEWTSVTAEGWGNTAMTGKKFSMDLKGKRSVGDAGNDYVARTAWAKGLDCSSKAAITFPDGAKLEFNCVINVSNPGTGESTDIAALEFSVQSAGKPIYTPSV